MILFQFVPRIACRKFRYWALFAYRDRAGYSLRVCGIQLTIR